MSLAKLTVKKLLDLRFNNGDKLTIARAQTRPMNY